mmetsp:Transcript_28899/g.80812  ORF Transcript_28899/g.80812 Transcript_28899/m.80812 type:complete len:668 (+) Transcript_28899:35-2038(+)
MQVFRIAEKMKVVGLISGGKDSCYNLMQCVKYGHEVVALAHLHPPKAVVAASGSEELDSHMFQTVGSCAVEQMAECMDLPLFTAPLKRKSHVTSLHYTYSPNDEIEDLFDLLAQVKEKIPDVQAVASGAILSNYQRDRVENVCLRHKLVSLAYLWQRNQSELLDEMVRDGVEAILIKVASMGLQPSFLGRTLEDLTPCLSELHEKYGLNVCGEGGEYETITLDCPLFKRRLSLDNTSILDETKDPFSPVAHLVIHSASTKPKENWKPYIPTKSEFDQNPAFPMVKEEKNPAKVASHEEFRTPQSWIQHACDFAHAGVTSYKELPTPELVHEMLGSLVEKCQAEGFSVRDIFAVTLYVPSMAEFGSVNVKYISFFEDAKEAERKQGRPAFPMPIRACVELCDAQGVHIEAFASRHEQRGSLHVQSISAWAPASIGPYAQGASVGGLVVLAGNIPLDAATMAIVPGGLHCEMREVLKNMRAVLDCMKSGLRHCLALEIFVQSMHSAAKNQAMVDAIRSDLRTAYADSPLPSLLFVFVDCLPRNCNVEIRPFAIEAGHELPRQSSEVLDGVSIARCAGGEYEHIIYRIPYPFDQGAIGTLWNIVESSVKKDIANGAFSVQCFAHASFFTSDIAASLQRSTQEIVGPWTNAGETDFSFAVCLLLRVPSQRL